MNPRLMSAVLALALAPLLAVPTARATAAAPVRECSNAQVKASYHGGDAAMGHRFGRIVLTNVSTRSCSVRGFGGLSYVGPGDGRQVGAAADRAPGTAVRTVVLAPGARARSQVSEAVAGVYDASACVPTAVDGFRVYVPDSTAAQFVAHPTTGCADADVHLLSHRAFGGR